VLPLLPKTTFWPLPSAGSGQVYWWVYSWKYGAYLDSPPTAANCPDQAPMKVGVSARYYNDGAFLNDTSLIAINYFKDHACTYRDPGREAILRWYSRGFQPSATTVVDHEGSANYSASFLSFRGDGRWMPDRSLQTEFRDASGATKQTVNGRYAPTVNSQHAYIDGFSYSFADGDFPVYGTLPDRPLSADVVVTRQSVPGQIDDEGIYCRYAAGQSGWDAQRYQLTNCTTYPPVKWAVYFRRTSFTYQGKQVQYVGYSETPDAGGAGACEEWWFAEDIGPIYIAKYRPQDWAACKQVLAATSAGGQVSNPAAHFQQRMPQLRGWLELLESCLQSCDVVL
jgi:hypothetical protein